MKSPKSPKARKPPSAQGIGATLTGAGSSFKPVRSGTPPRKVNPTPISTSRSRGASPNAKTRSRNASPAPRTASKSNSGALAKDRKQALLIARGGGYPETSVDRKSSGSRSASPASTLASTYEAPRPYIPESARSRRNIPEKQDLQDFTLLRGPYQTPTYSGGPKAQLVDRRAAQSSITAASLGPVKEEKDESGKGTLNTRLNNLMTSGERVQRSNCHYTFLQFSMTFLP